MIQSYEDLYQQIKLVTDAYAQLEDSVPVAVEVAKNNTCSVTNQANGSKIVFMLAKLGDDLKVGYAYFSQGEREPEWIDDAEVESVDESFLLTLIKEQLIAEDFF